MSNKSKTNDYISLYRALLWGRESTVRKCASQYYDKNDAYLVELACGLSQLPRSTPWYRFDQKITRLCLNTWMRLFRKNALRVLLTEGYTPDTFEVKSYCKPIVKALLEKYSHTSPLSAEDQRRQANLINFAKAEKWNDLVSLDDETQKTQPPAEVNSRPVPEQPSNTTEPESNVLPAFEAQSELKPPYVSDYAGQETDWKPVPHNPNASTKTATSHHLDVSKPD